MTTNKPEVKRYDCTSGYSRHCYGCYTMEEDELGDYVKHKDYEALQEEALRLRVAMAKAAQRADDWPDSNDDPAYVLSDCASILFDAIG